MKRLWFLASLLVLSTAAWGQSAPGNTIPTVLYEQGKIIGSLPYGRYFYIKGNTKLPNNKRADKVRVRIWDSGRSKLMRSKGLPALDATQMGGIMASAPLDSATWNADRATDTLFFYLYMNRNLNFSSEYLLEFTFYEQEEFLLTSAQKEEVFQQVENRVFDQFKAKGGISQNDIQRLISEEVSLYFQLGISDSDLNAGETFAQKPQTSVKLVPGAIEKLSNEIGKYSSSFRLIEELDLEIKQAESDLKNLTPGTREYEDVQQVIIDFKKQQSDARARVGELRDKLPELLEPIRTQEVEVSSSYVITNPSELSVTDLQAIRIGSSFGSGIVGLNFLEEDRGYDVFGYSALKFYFLPVDKRVADPYLTNRFFINRLSLLVGFSINREINYNGSLLQRPIGFYPVAGLSYDINRYLSVDLAATMFKQQSLSSLTQAQTIRFGPVIGINFDADLFNRVDALITGEQYNINPGGN